MLYGCRMAIMGFLSFIFGAEDMVRSSQVLRDVVGILGAS